MKYLTGVLAAALACVVCAGALQGDTLWDYEAVNADGTGSHWLVGADPVEQNRVTVEGVALAGVDEILDPAEMYTIFLQDDASDRGGLQVWAGVWWYDVWRPAEYIDFAAGDSVRVTGFLGNHNGKVFINDRHSDDPLIRFTVEIIGHPGLPDPQLIPSVANCNHFLQDRTDGGERYQTRWTMIHGVEVTSGGWANDSDLVIADDTGSVGLKLSQMGDFDGNAPPADRISVVGIFDQEDLQSPFHDTYRIWVKKQEDTAAALDSCREVSTCGNGNRAALVNKTVSRVYNGCFYIQDADRSGGVRIESSRLVSVGDVVHVLGSVSTVDGEKAINPSYLTVDGSNAVEPVFVNRRVLRGEGGLDVFGLLARCVGTLGEDLGGGAYEFVDEEGQVIALDSNGAAMPPEGSTVSVTGVVRYGSSGPVILLSGAEDIQVLQ